MDSDVVNLGASFALTDQLSVFAQGDYSYTKDGTNGGNGQGWAWYGGLTYEMPMGVILEAGWRHETYRWKYRGDLLPGIGTHVKGRHDTIYANLGFEF